MNIDKALKAGTIKLNEAKITSAALDARLLLSHHVLEQPVEYLLLYPERSLTTTQQEIFFNAINDRYALKPLAYILGYKEFYGRKFGINDKVLIPRADTEILIDAVLFNHSKQDARVLELGCGSGCIIITLLLEINKGSGVACDISLDAVRATKANAMLHDIDERLEIVESDWFADIKKQKFDIIVCNPPYVAEHEKHLMSEETLKYEPRLALFAEDSGLGIYKVIARNSANFMQAGGKLFLEIGFSQETQVKEIFTSQGYIFKESFKDLNNHTRVLYFVLNNLM